MTVTCECDRCKKIVTPGEMYVLQTRQLVRELEVDTSFDICSKCRMEFFSWMNNDDDTA